MFRDKTALFSLVVAVLISSNLACKRHTMVGLQVSNFKFDGYYATVNHETSEQRYCLLGKYYADTTAISAIGGVIQHWIKSHPTAKVYPVYAFGPLRNKSPLSRQTYCWVYDQHDTLNTYLVKQGCISAAALQRPKLWREMTPNERAQYQEPGNFEEAYVNDNEFEVLLKQAVVAEQMAQKQHLGIWSLRLK